MAEPLTRQEERALRIRVGSSHEQGWGIAIGLVLVWDCCWLLSVLVAKGGPNPGAHLRPPPHLFSRL